MIDVRDDRDVADIHFVFRRGLLAAVYTHGSCHRQGGLSARLAAVKVQKVHKRSVTIDGHRTSISLEDAFWEELSALARARRLSLNALVAEIDHGRTLAGGVPGNLSSALRLHVLEALRRRASPG